MFDDVFGMMARCAENFQGGLLDSFGASIVDDVLDPILNEIDSLRVLNEDCIRQAFNIDRILEEVRKIQFKDVRSAQ